MMTAQDFVRIADVLDANLAPLDMVQDMADMLEDQNPRFDRPRFIAAATLKTRTQGLVKVREYKTYAREGVSIDA